MAIGPGGKYPKAKVKDPDRGEEEMRNRAPTGGRQRTSEAYGPVEHMHQSAPGKIEKKPGSALNTKEPKGGVGKDPLMGMGMKGKGGGFSGTDRPKTKDFDITRDTDHPLAEFRQADDPSNHTGRALQDQMIAPGGEREHVRRIAAKVDRGAGMAENSEFRNTSEDAASGAAGPLNKRGA